MNKDFTWNQIGIPAIVRRRVLYVLSFSLFFFLAGCSGKSGVIKVHNNEVDPAIVVKVAIPLAVNLNEVDGKSVINMLRTSDTEYHFAPGFHRVVLQYEEVWEIGADDHSVIKSKEVTQEWNLEPGAQYQLMYKPAANLDESKQTAANFSPWIKMISKANLDKAEVKAALQKSPDSQQLQQLKVWWERASETDRNKFKTWIETP